MAGRIVAGPIVRDACARHLRDLEHAHERGFRFDESRADYAFGYFREILRLNGGEFEGQAFEVAPAQAFILGSLWGWVDTEGYRRFNTAYVEQGKGNGKSPLAAGIGLLGLTSDGEPRAEIYAAATKKDQAMVLFRDAVAMVEQSPALKRGLDKSGRQDRVWNLYHPKTGSFFRPISSDDGQSGPRPHIALVDELHEHKTNYVVEMMRAGFKFRTQPLLFMITNSGHNRATVCWEYHEYARRVCAGASDDDRFFAYVCSLDEDDDPFEDEGCWPKANPLLGETIDLQYLRDQVTAARGMPSKESVVRRLNFCQWTEANNPFIPFDRWKGSEESYSLDDFRGRTAIMALDLSATTDLTAAVLVFQKDGKFYVWAVFWIPADGIAERCKRDGVPYDAWVRNGAVLTTPGSAIDKDFVVGNLAKLLGEHDITLSAAPFDRWRIDTLKAAAKRVGVDWPLEGFGQGFASMGPAIDALETALVSGTFRHPGNPCLTWNAANAVAISDPAGNRKLDKSKATGRIDGMVATVMAMGVAAADKPTPAFQMLIL